MSSSRIRLQISELLQVEVRDGTYHKTRDPEREGDNCPEEVLEEYTNPDTCRYAQMIEEIRRLQNFTTLRYHRLDDLLASIGLEPCRVCTYCFDGKE